MTKRNWKDSQEDIPGPGYVRLREKAGAAYEALRADTVRRQREAMEAVAPPAAPKKEKRTARHELEYPRAPRRAGVVLRGDGLALHAARWAMGLTQSQFSKILDVQRSTVSKWEQMRVMYPKTKRNIEYRLKMKVFR